ncbi:hypothetical protein [Vallitalea guaymasensis]|uniref:hypothetical protein n=1 Tax=Vallitalea guaymasensis TaxID=1185412 RepID=UPI000DE2BCC2|nr:hypothetical protein [Vallitalea guaymasensis]
MIKNLKKVVCVLISLIIVSMNFNVLVYANEEENYVKVHMASHRTYIEYPDGTIKAAGTNYDYSLGVGNTSSTRPISVFTDVVGIPKGRNITKFIENGKSFAVVLLDDGSVYSAGSRFCSELGVDRDHSGDFHKVSWPNSIVDIQYISSKGTKFVGIDNKGCLWYLGTTEFGDSFPVTPRKYTGLSGIRKYLHPYALTSDGNLYHLKYSGIKVAENITDINKVSSQLYSVLDNSGNLYLFGANNRNEIDDTGNEVTIENMKLIKTDVRQIIDKSYVCNNGEFYIFNESSRKYKNIGNLPTKVKNFYTDYSSNYTIVLGEDNNIYSQGVYPPNIGYFNGNTELPVLTKVYENVDKATISYYCMYIYKDNNLYGVGKEVATEDGPEKYDELTLIKEGIKKYEFNKIVDNDNRLLVTGGGSSNIGIGTPIKYWYDMGIKVSSLNGEHISTDKKISLSYSTNILNESDSNDGSINDILTISLDNDTFTGEINDDLLDKVEILNLPEGLIASVLKVNDTQVTINISGNATRHYNMDSIDNLTVIFKDAAFTSGDASKIEANSKNDIKLNFIDPSQITYFTKEFLESESNDGSIETISYASLHTNKFIDTVGSDLVSLGKVEVSNLPDGLSMKVKLNADNNASIILEGKAVDHLISSNIDNLNIKFKDSAFKNQNDLNIIDKSMNFSIVFKDNPNIVYSSNAFKEDLNLNDGSISTKISAVLNGENYIGNNNEDLSSNITVNNLPEGLKVKAIKVDNTLELTLEGNATNHTSSDSIGNLEFTFDNSTFVGNNASNIFNYHKTFSIQFEDAVSIETATRKVENAEKSQLEKDYKDALVIVNMLDESDKGVLLNRLSTLKSIIDSIRLAEPLVDSAISSKDVIAYFKAKDKVDDLANGDEKTRLILKLENLRQELKASGKIKDGDTIFDHINQQPVTPPTPSTPPSSSGGETKIIYVEKKSSEEKKKEDEINKARNDMLKEINSTVKDLSLLTIK